LGLPHAPRKRDLGALSGRPWHGRTCHTGVCRLVNPELSMRRRFKAHGVVPPVLMVVMLVSSSGSADAQVSRDFHTGMRTGIGYSAVFPDVVAGVGAWHILAGRSFGIFADAKMTVSDLRNDPLHCPSVITPCTVEAVESVRNDIFIRDDDEYRIFNIGGIYAITGEFMLLLGAGAVQSRTVREYFDDSEDPITETGTYFVDHETDPDLSMQIVGSMIMRAGNRLAFRFGYETAPGGMSLGAYLILP
jgi:hypothetical protein